MHCVVLFDSVDVLGSDTPCVAEAPQLESESGNQDSALAPVLEIDVTYTSTDVCRGCNTAGAEH